MIITVCFYMYNHTNVHSTTHLGISQAETGVGLWLPLSHNDLSLSSNGQAPSGEAECLGRLSEGIISQGVFQAGDVPLLDNLVCHCESGSVFVPSKPPSTLPNPPCSGWHEVQMLSQSFGTSGAPLICFLHLSPRCFWGCVHLHKDSSAHCSQVGGLVMVQSASAVVILLTSASLLFFQWRRNYTVRISNIYLCWFFVCA